MKDSKNIVIIAWRDIWHPSAGGAEVYITKVAEYLRDKGFNIYFLTAKYPNSKREETVDGINYIRRGNAVTIYYFLPKHFRKHLKKTTHLLIENYNSIPFRIPKYFNKNLTVIHHLPEDKEVWRSNYKFTNNKILQSFLSLCLRINYILGNPGGKLFLNQLIRLYSKNQDIITVSQSSQEELIKKGFTKGNISLLYNGIITPITDDISKPKDSINIVSVGRLRPTKNIDKGIELIKYSKEHLGIDNIILNIAGKGGAEEQLKSLVKKYNLEDSVKFLGYISEEEKELLLKKSHLHIQFSDKEGWGITVIEAAAQATPTICFNVPGLRDSVKPTTGYIVDTSLEETWKQALNDIKKYSDKYVEKQRNCIEWAKNFKWEEQLKNLDKYLQQKEK